MVAPCVAALALAFTASVTGPAHADEIAGLSQELQFYVDTSFVPVPSGVEVDISYDTRPYCPQSAACTLRWSPRSFTIALSPEYADDPWTVLHEVAHVLDWTAELPDSGVDLAAVRRRFGELDPPSAARGWTEEGDGWASIPSERFAELYAVCAVGGTSARRGIVTTSAIRMAARPFGQFCDLLRTAFVGRRFLAPLYVAREPIPARRPECSVRPELRDACSLGAVRHRGPRAAAAKAARVRPHQCALRRRTRLRRVYRCAGQLVTVTTTRRGRVRGVRLIR